MTTLNHKKPFSMPHVFVILFIIMILVTVISYIVPSGEFERTTSENGSTVVNPDVFSFVEQEDPIGLIDFFTAIYTGVVQGANIMASLLICSGCLGILNATKTLESAIGRLIQITHGRNMVAIIIFYVYFAVMNIKGAGEGQYPFYPIVAGIIVSLGYDRVMGMATIVLASTAGFACGMANLFTTGISQQIVGLPLFSGIGYRTIVFVVLFTIGLISVLRYGKRITKNPDKSYVAEDYKAQLSADRAAARETGADAVEFTGKRKIALAIFLVLIAACIYCSIALGYGLPQISAFYVMFAIVIAVLFRMSSQEFCKTFVTGASRVLTAAFAIGFVRSVMVLLEQAQIMDTIVYYMGSALQDKGTIFTLLLIYLFVTVFNFFVVSGSGKAVIMMPIMSPLGKMLGINQQVMVLTYQLGDGLTNNLWPAGVLVCCSLCELDYGTWFKFAWKPILAMIVSGFILIVIANAIDYGPF